MIYKNYSSDQNVWKTMALTHELCHFRNFSQTTILSLTPLPQFSSWLEFQGWKFFMSGFPSLFAAACTWPVGQQHYPLCGGERRWSPGVPAPVPLLALCYWHGLHYFFSSHSTGYFLVQHQAHQPWWMHHSDVLSAWIHIMESFVLLAMAFDCFVAICKSLQYARTLINTRITKSGLLFFIRMLFTLTPLLLLLKGLSFCGLNVLSHSYCYHPDVLKCSLV